MRWAIYFAAESTGRFIKIGSTWQPNIRINAIRRMAETRYGAKGAEYIGLLNEPMELETKLHIRFRHLRDRGDWFRADPELLDFIEEQRPAFQPVAFFGDQRAAYREYCRVMEVRYAR